MKPIEQTEVVRRDIISIAGLLHELKSDLKITNSNIKDYTHEIADKEGYLSVLKEQLKGAQARRKKIEKMLETIERKK